ncbi:hypothetical protein C8R44DRAFT_747332 [Mycena epipterygia]|nr:hypothetical protein C8R44DRAFT_747332 [Mycena epipterygia]
MEDTMNTTTLNIWFLNSCVTVAELELGVLAFQVRKHASLTDAPRKLVTAKPQNGGIRTVRTGRTAQIVSPHLKSPHPCPDPDTGGHTHFLDSLDSAAMSDTSSKSLHRRDPNGFSRPTSFYSYHLEDSVGLPPVTVSTVRRHPCHGCHAGSVSSFLQAPTAQLRDGLTLQRPVETRPSRPFNGAFFLCSERTNWSFFLSRRHFWGCIEGIEEARTNPDSYKSTGYHMNRF